MFGSREIDKLTLGDAEHDYSLVVEFVGSADTGKTCGMIALMLELVEHLGYKSSEVYGNLWVDLDGYNELDNVGLRMFLRELFAKEYRHKIILADEIDSVYPSRGFQDKLQTEEILRLNQMTKTENWFLFTRHLGSAVDKIVRDCTNISVQPQYVPEEDKLVLEAINAVDCSDDLVVREICPVSEIFKRYHRWQPIH